MVILILRVIHILLGVFWAGAVFMVALFVQPAIAASGPEGGKVMGALVKRRRRGTCRSLAPRGQHASPATGRFAAPCSRAV